MIIVIRYNLWIYMVLSFSVLSVFSVVKSRTARCLGESQLRSCGHPPGAQGSSQSPIRRARSFGVSEVGLMADGRQDDALGPR